MVWNLKHLICFLGTILIISITTNFFIFSVLQNQPKSIKELKISQKISEQESPNQIDKKLKKIDQSNDKNSQNHFETTAAQFTVFAFSWQEETYLTRKRQANQYMSESLKQTLFASSGSDGKFTASVSEIEVFLNRDDPEHCLVRFKRTLTIDSNGYEETSDELVELTFTNQDSRYIVDQMKSLKSSGGV